MTAPRRGLSSVLIYIGIILGVNFASSMAYQMFFSLIMSNFRASLFSAMSILFGLADTLAVGIVHALLFRRFVFRSRKSAAKPIALLILLYFARSIVYSLINSQLTTLVVTGAMTSESYHALTGILSFVLALGVYTLGYVIQRNHYREEDAPVVQRAAQSSILAVDLEDNARHVSHPEQARVFCPGADRESGPASLRAFRRFSLEEDTEPVIAQSSRDAIRVMEHKALDIQHEWNCDDRDSARQPQTPERVIVPGSGNPVHVAEHSSLDIRHEWNCGDQ